MDSPLLPWEVIERVIGHSSDHSSTLYNLSLTCRQLRPRALCLMVAHVALKSRERIFDFCAVLQAKPHLKPLVRSTVVDPTDFAPVPFLRILPNLSEIRFTSSKETIVATHSSNLTCIRLFAAHVKTLHLSNVFFATYLPLARILLAFTNLAHLTCVDIKVTTSSKQLTHLDVLKRRLSQRLRLKSLTIDSSSPIRWMNHDPSMPMAADGLLFGSDVAPTLENLKLIQVHAGQGSESNHDLTSGSDWSRLRSLVLQIPEGSGPLSWALGVLENAYGPALKEVTLVVSPVTSVAATAKGLSTPGPADTGYEKLEYALLRFPHPRITWIMGKPLRAGRTSFWTRQLEKRFPVLAQRDALALESETDVIYGHDGNLRALAISPAGEWVASGSDDFTIILWDAANGNIADQWVAHDYNEVSSLAFSPNSRHLVSGGGDGKLAIWDLSEGSAWRVATLEGHATPISSCAWSPDGTSIASGAFDGTVIVWDAHTFDQFHILRQSPTRSVKAQYVTFSPDGRWLASWSFPSSYCIWDVSSGTLRKFIQPDLNRRVQRLDIAAAFDPGSTRLATVSRWDGVEVWDIGTGARQVALRRTGEVQDVSFSPDGRLLVTASNDRTVKVWDAYTGVELLRLLGHTNIVSKACFSPRGNYVASGSWDGTVRLWRTSDGSCLRSFSEHEECHVNHIFFSPDGAALWSGAEDGSVVFRRMHDIIPTED